MAWLKTGAYRVVLAALCLAPMTAEAALPANVASGLDRAMSDARDIQRREAERSGARDAELSRILSGRARDQALQAIDAAVIQAIGDNPVNGEEILARVRAGMPDLADAITRDVAAVYPFLGQRAAATAPPVAAQATLPPPAAPPVPPPTLVPVPAATPASASVLINLINSLVQAGMLSEAKGAELIRNAQDEIAIATRQASAGAPVSPGVVAAAPSSPGAPASAGAAATSPPSVRVPYVPEVVKKQIAADVKQEVIATAKAENWAAPNEIPEWTKRFHFSGDLRLRSEWDLFDSRNSNLFPNFAALNSGNAFDLDAPFTNPIPLLNTTDDRQRFRVRARLGLTADITDELTAGLRLATGNTTNPVSTNQTLGNSLNKDPIQLDRVDLRYVPNQWATIWGGRFNNPWLSTDLVWSTQLMFDGAAVKFTPRISDTIKTFATFGAFPIENTAFNFPDNSFDKQESRDKWLYGAQAGVEWQPHRSYGLEFGVAYYDFSKIEGKLSSPCAPTSSTFPCDTDNSRPGFQQQGNTLFAIRNNTAPANEFQYFGLASPFRELNITTRFDYGGYDPIHLILEGDFVTNLAFNAGKVAAKNPVNNRGATPDINTIGPFDGGGTGFMARLTVGHKEMEKFGDWNASIAYKYLGSDAVVDAFTDSDFHLGGTNAKGYIVGANFGLTHNVYMAAKWLSATEVTGPPYSVDVVQVDLNARF